MAKLFLVLAVIAMCATVPRAQAVFVGLGGALCGDWIKSHDAWALTHDDRLPMSASLVPWMTGFMEGGMAALARQPPRRSMNTYFALLSDGCRAQRDYTIREVAYDILQSELKP